jgi:hypothetical protein
VHASRPTSGTLHASRHNSGSVHASRHTSGTVHASRPTSVTGPYRLPQVRILRYRSVGYLRYKQQASSGMDRRSKLRSVWLVYLRYRQEGLSLKVSRLLLYRRVGYPKFLSTSDTGTKVISRYRPECHPQVQCRVLHQVHCYMFNKHTVVYLM